MMIETPAAHGDDDKVEMARVFDDYLRRANDFEYSGHRDNFKFILKDIQFTKATIMAEYGKDIRHNIIAMKLKT